MPHNQTATKTLVIVLTTLFCTGFFFIWLPQKVDQKSQHITHLEQIQSEQDGQKVELVSQELVDITQQTPLAQSQSDQLEADQLSEPFQNIEETSEQQASQILSNRFKPVDGQWDLSPSTFVVPTGLRDIVQFWTHLFGRYTDQHVIFYNEDNCGIVYSVLDFTGLDDLDDAARDSVRAQVAHDETERLKQGLKKIAARLNDPKATLTDLTGDEQRIAQLLLQNKDSLDLSEAELVNSLKLRNGFAHRFKGAIVQSGKYLDDFRRIFRERGLPEELTVIPFFESAFNAQAYSHSDAAGVWQFIEATGKQYLHIDNYVDERYDPILSAYAAATHLATEYKMLKSWPLTINAYNTGPGRMKAAVAELKTKDFAQIVKNFKGSGYGFDSRNYFPEFLAALTVYNNKEYYFGNIEPLPPEPYEYVSVPCPTNLIELAKESGVDFKALTTMNPSLRVDVASGIKDLPRGYLIKIPPHIKQDVLLAMQNIHQDLLLATHHIVKEGDTLEGVAKIYEVPLDDLALANNMLPKQSTKAGMILRLPSRGGNDVQVGSVGDKQTVNR